MGQDVDGNYVNDFPEKILIWGKWAILGLKMAHLHNFGSALRIFFENWHNERGQEVHGNHINGFLEKILILSKWCIVITLEPLRGFI